MLRNEFTVSRAMQIAVVSVAMLAAAPANAGFFDFLFQQNNAPRRQAAPQPQQPGTFDPFGLNTPAQQPQSQYPYVEASGGRSSSYCVRTCDGRYFPIQSSSSASAAQVCQSFCPASVTKVFSGSSIGGAQAHDGARYGDLANAFLFRQKLVSGCTCNGRDGMGLAPVDLSLDQTLRSGDVVATTSGFVAYNSSDYTPVNAYAGLTADARVKLGGTKIAPVSDAPEDITASISSQGQVRISESNAVQ